MTPSQIEHQSSPYRPLAAVGCFLFGTVAAAMCAQSVFSERVIAETVVSPTLWGDVVTRWGAKPPQIARGEFDVPLWKVMQPVATLAFFGLIAGTLWQWVRTRRRVDSICTESALRGWMWWWLPGLWEFLHVLAAGAEWNGFLSMLVATLPLCLAAAAAGCVATLFSTQQYDPIPISSGRARSAYVALGVLCAVYAGVFTWMNWQLYWGLHVPHGDSAMYEEHLWNITHGKGFRSYLDNGRLFLGEHVQVIHLALVPLHFVWPSHLLLELSESLALASGAIPVFWMARRHTDSSRIALCLAAAYLFSFPLHFLDISLDTKTFRPISFGVPLMLFALDQMERRRLRTMAVLLLLAICAKEDFAVMISMFGVWLAATSWRKAKTDPTSNRRRWLGIALAAFGLIYVLVVIKLVIPAFRDGDPHYFRYFGELGNSPGDVLAKLRTEPGVVFGKFFSQRSLQYALLLLAPVGFLPLLSPSRLATAVPLFGVLCLLELTSDPAKQGTDLLIPVHHFHAPILPFLFWAAAAGLGNLRERTIGFVHLSRDWLASFAVASAVCTGLFLSFHPIGLPFWDAGSDKYWEKWYVPGERAAKFEAVRKLIPDDARVFSTDFVHTRLTHCRRSYDYSGFQRKSDDELANPIAGETYYIVIDARSRYSRVRSPEDVAEFRDHPEDWELIRHEAEDFFIVLKRRG